MKEEVYKMKRLFAALLALTLLVCAVPAMAEEAAPATPKYVFMFIGDGMGNPQVTATQYYLARWRIPIPSCPSPRRFPSPVLKTSA